MHHDPDRPPTIPGERAIPTEAELRAAVAETFLHNADADNHTANDDLIAALGTVRRSP